MTLPATTNLHRPGTDFSPNLKGCLKSAVPYYVNSNGMSSVTNYFLSVNPTAKSLPMWTVTGILVACKMPTNWFEYTPPRSLSGIGGATNDASVGHAYGYTNAWTILGGTNYPAVRSKWYTTDYGYGASTALFSRLRSVAVTPNVAITYAGTSRSAPNGWLNRAAVIDPASGAHSYFTTISTNVKSQVRGYGCYYYEYFTWLAGNWYAEPTKFRGAEWAARWMYSWTNPYTNVAGSASCFMNMRRAAYSLYGLFAYFPNWDTYVTNVVSSINVDSPVVGWKETSLNLLTTIAFEKGSNVLASGWFGTTNSYIDAHGFSDGFGWSAQPFTNGLIPGANNYSGKGWQWYDTDYIVLTYDFVYK